MEEKSSPQPTPEASFDGIATNKSIPQPTAKVNLPTKNLQRKSAAKRESPLQRRFRTNPPTSNAIVTDIENSYKATAWEKVKDISFATQIAFTNAQAGIEKVGKKYGAKNIEALVQAARSATN